MAAKGVEDGQSGHVSLPRWPEFTRSWISHPQNFPQGRSARFVFAGFWRNHNLSLSVPHTHKISTHTHSMGKYANFMKHEDENTSTHFTILFQTHPLTHIHIYLDWLAQPKLFTLGLITIFPWKWHLWCAWICISSLLSQLDETDLLSLSFYPC